MNKITTSFNKNIGIVTLNDPETENSTDINLLESVTHSIKKLEADKQADLIWLKSGIDNIFSTGYNISYFEEKNEPECRFFAKVGAELVETIKGCKKIIVCTVDGAALGGGFEIILSCDLIFATERSWFGFPEVNYGILPGFGGTQLLNRKIYETFTKYLIFTGNTVSASELYEKGIINKLTKDLRNNEEEVFTIANIIKQRSKFALGLAKETVNNGLNMPLKQALLYEQNAFMASFASNDKKKGMTAFKQKRNPDFTDRWEDFETL